ncbi:MAG TPA: ankyrin repeat domain-containing protein, partial [Vicinamibacteria bacterium]
NTALILAANNGHQELAALLREAGAPVDHHEAAAIGDTEHVRSILDRNPELLDSFSTEGFTALGLAAHFGHLDTMRLLLDRGADVSVVSRHPIGATPLIAALFGRRVEAARILIERGADVQRARGGKGWPRAGWTPLHYAAAFGFPEIVSLLLERGASVDARDDSGATPLEVAREASREDIARLLLGQAARTEQLSPSSARAEPSEEAPSSGARRAPSSPREERGERARRRGARALRKDS